MGALAEERTDFLVIEASDYLDGAGVCVSKAGGNQGFDSGEGTKLVVHATCKDEFLVQAAELGWLSVKEFELPIDDAAVCLVLAN